LKTTKSPEKFLEDSVVPCVLVKAKFDLDAEGHRFVRMDFETPMREAYKFIPENMQQVYDSMGNAGAIKSDFGVEFNNRMVELFFKVTKGAERVIDSTKITKVQFRRKDTESEMKLGFSVTESAANLGHWVVDHFGDPMFIKCIHAQLELR
jgi:hypothetical protein